MSALVPLHQESHIEQQYQNTNVYYDLGKAALQTGISFALEFLPDTITIYFLSQTDNQIWVGAFGYGYLMCRAFGLGVLNGLACGLETLVSQAFGASKFELCCKLYYRALYTSTLLMIPISILLSTCVYALHAINDNKELIDATGLYARLMILAVWLNGIYVNTKVYLNGQNIYNLQMYTQGITCMLSAAMNYFFIIYLNYGLVGSVVSRTLLEISNNIILQLFIYFTNCCHKTYIPFRKQHLKNSLKFLLNAIPIGTILWFEWVCYEFYMMQASYLSAELLSANVIMSNWTAFYYQFSYGVSIAATTFVGIEMGKKNALLAAKYARSSLIMEAVFLVVTLSIIFILRKQFCQLLTTNLQVQEQLLDNMLNMLIMITCDGFQGVLSGLVRGIGKEKFAAMTFILCYMCIGQVVSYLLCFTADWKLYGIWVGMICGAFLYDMLQIGNLLWKKWEILAEQINLKMEKFSIHQASVKISVFNHH